VENTAGEQRFLLPCSAAEGESQAIVTAIAQALTSRLGRSLKIDGDRAILRRF
jgi:hypothetical protein